MSSPATRSAPTPAGTPWGRPRTAHAAAPALSLAEIQREQQVDEDAALARRMAELERREEEQLAAALAASMQPDNHDEDKDEEDDAAAGAAAAPAAAAPSADGDADADMAIAQALQAEFDREHDQELAARERLMNKNNSKVGWRPGVSECVVRQAGWGRRRRTPWIPAAGAAGLLQPSGRCHRLTQ